MSTHIGKIANKHKTGYYWIKQYQDSEWSIGFYQSGKGWLFMGKSESDTYIEPVMINWNTITMYVENISKTQGVYNRLMLLDKNESFSRDELIGSLWGDNTTFIKRSFSVTYIQVQKRITEETKDLPEGPRKFISRKGQIIRSN